MFRIDVARALKGLRGVEVVFRGVRDRCLGTATLTIVPSPNDRGAGRTNTEVLRYLAKKHPGLLTVRGGEIDRLVRAAAKVAFKPLSSTVADMAAVAGPVVAHAIAARLESGQVVTNTPETLARKARLGRGQTPGIETKQLAEALRSADVKVE